MQIFKIIIACLLGYLIGSIPWALVVGKLFYKTDIREHGSGNLGGTNAGRVLGKKAGISVTVLDALKAAIVVAVCALYLPSATVLAGLATCIGHCFPIFAHFKGGKAVATTFGYLLSISIFVTHEIAFMFVIPVCIFFLILAISKMVSLSSIISLISATIITFFVQKDLIISLSILILTVFVTYRHKANIIRIIQGKEKKITWIK